PPPRPSPALARPTRFPYTTLFRSLVRVDEAGGEVVRHQRGVGQQPIGQRLQPGLARDLRAGAPLGLVGQVEVFQARLAVGGLDVDRKSTRLNSSHVKSSYAVFCSK